jgi:DNA-binding XRE family transcriptional regulator
MPHIIPGRDAVRLVTEGQYALGLTQGQLGSLLTASRRTISRWVSGRSRPSVTQLQRLACAVHPRNAVLAAKLAAEGGQTLEGLGLVRPTPPPMPAPATPPPPQRPFPPARLLVESVVCAAAETMQAPPTVVREALRAAFARTEALGLSVEEVNEALSTPADPGASKGSTRAKRPAGGQT